MKVAKKEQRETSWQEDFSSKCKEIKRAYNEKEIKQMEEWRRERRKLECNEGILRDLFKKLNANIRKMANENKFFSGFLKQLANCYRGGVFVDWTDVKEFKVKGLTDCRRSPMGNTLLLYFCYRKKKPTFFLANSGFSGNLEYIDDPTSFLESIMADNKFDYICSSIKTLCNPENLSKFLISEFKDTIFADYAKEN